MRADGRADGELAAGDAVGRGHVCVGERDDHCAVCGVCGAPWGAVFVAGELRVLGFLGVWRRGLMACGGVVDVLWEEELDTADDVDEEDADLCESRDGEWDLWFLWGWILLTRYGVL